MNRYFQETTLSKLLCLSSEKGYILKVKNFLPMGANSFFLEQTPFQKWLGVQECKQEVTKVFSLITKWLKIYQVYQVPIRCIDTAPRKITLTRNYLPPFSVANLKGNDLPILSSALICLFVLFYSGFTSLSKPFSHIATVSGCGKELNAHFSSAASLKYHAPDTLHDNPPSHIILTLNWPVLIPNSAFLMLSGKRKSSLYHF